jgi:hypothetical protein
MHVSALAALKVICLAGLACGVLDLLASTTLFALKGIPFVRLLQGIASGALGPSALSGGKKSAVVGLFFHFFIAFSVSAAYFLTSRHVALLLKDAAVSGMLYGAGVHLFMTFVVVPASAAAKRQFSLRGFLAQLLVHMFLVGLPISLIVLRFS